MYQLLSDFVLKPLLSVKKTPIIKPIPAVFIAVPIALKPFETAFNPFFASAPDLPTSLTPFAVLSA